MLKSNKGLTLTSLVIYVIVLLIVIGLMSGFSGYFFKNANIITVKENYEEQYTRFLAYLIKDTNSDQLNFIKIIKTESEDNYLILRFKDGSQHQYVYSDKSKSIYYINVSETAPKKILLCNKVEDLTMMYSANILQLNMKINGRSYEKNINISI